MAIQVRQDFQLTLETSVSLTTMTKTRIYYKRPKDTKSEYINATVSTTTMIGNITKAINNQAGTWAFQAFAEGADGKIYWGTIANLTINSNI